MKNLNVNYSKGQLKIQQMAFVLVATMIFFALVFLFYAVVRYSSLEGEVEDLRSQEVLETIRKISTTAEFKVIGRDIFTDIIVGIFDPNLFYNKTFNVDLTS